MPKVPYPYEVNGKLLTGNGSLIPICSLLLSLTEFDFMSMLMFLTFYLFQAMEAINHKATAAILIPMHLPRNTKNPTVHNSRLMIKNMYLDFFCTNTWSKVQLE